MNTLALLTRATRARPDTLGCFMLSCVALSSIAPAARAAEHPLRVHANHRYLVQANGQPFFYLGDTAWELFHRLNREEADVYLANRAKKGFTVIQAVLLAELEGLHEANALGDKPLDDNDPTRPNEKYFAHVDEVVQRAGALGLTMALVPAWGDKWHSRHISPGPKVFTEANAFAYGRFVGQRYAKSPVIWLLGGDRNPESKDDLAIVRAMAKGIRAGDPANLITFHPRGPGRSSDYFHNDGWLSFNAVQSSHAARDFDNGLFIEHDYNKAPAKPTLDAEPRYENLVVGFYLAGANPALRFDDADVRQAAYWALLAGAAGHTYGNNSVWQMFAPGRSGVLSPGVPWSEAIDHPGALQMGHVRKLFESRPFELLIPDQSIIAQQPGEPGAFIRAARARDRSFAFIYSPRGATIAVHLDQFKARDVRLSWYDPRYGIAHNVMTGEASASNAFTPPTSGRGQDWVLVIDDAAKNFPPPGKSWTRPAPTR